jgi:hypothetical protein
MDPKNQFNDRNEFIESQIENIMNYFNNSKLREEIACKMKKVIWNKNIQKPVPAS